ncbi:MAG: response regulator [Acidobacteriota bacterium]|nr:response regulator [Acidobacteriota bacterium]
MDGELGADEDGPATRVVDVLVVDDDESARSSFAEVLRSAGLSVGEAGDGIEGLAYLMEVTARTIVLDVRMPNLDGPHFLDHLDDPPPVVLVTGAFYDDEVMARGSKVTWFLKKPVSPEELVTIVMRCLRRC